MITIVLLFLFLSLITISVAKTIEYLRERRRHRCIRRIAAFVASPREFDIERLLYIGQGASMQTIAEAIAYIIDHFHPATEQRLAIVVKFYGVDFYLIEQIKRHNNPKTTVLLSKIPLSRDAKQVLTSIQSRQSL